jgi:hypothetical protein
MWSSVRQETEDKKGGLLVCVTFRFDHNGLFAEKNKVIHWGKILEIILINMKGKYKYDIIFLIELLTAEESLKVI